MFSPGKCHYTLSCSCVVVCIVSEYIIRVGNIGEDDLIIFFWINYR